MGQNEVIFGGGGGGGILVLPTDRRIGPASSQIVNEIR